MAIPRDQTGAGDSRSDSALLAASETHVDAFAEFYDRHLESVLRYFYCRTGCPETSADLAAETFAQAFAARRRFRSIGAPAAAWLFKIARRQLNRFIRREVVATRHRAKLGVSGPDLTPQDYERIEELCDLKEDLLRLDTAFSTLDNRSADAVRLRIVDELPYRDIGQALGCSEGAARVRVCRALAKLAIDLGHPS